MAKKQRVPDADETLKKLKQGILDDTILYLSDEELRKELAAYLAEQPTKPSKPQAS